MVGQIKRFLDRRVAAPHDDDVLVAEKEPVAGGAGRDAEPTERVFAWNAEPACLCAGRQNYRVPHIDIARIAGRDEGPTTQVNRQHHVQDHPGADMLRLGVHLLHKPRALNDFGEAGIILDIGRDRQLAAGLKPGYQNRLQVRPRGVDRGGITRWTRADDQHFTVMALRHPANPVVWTAYYTIFPCSGTAALRGLPLLWGRSPAVMWCETAES